MSASIPCTVYIDEAGDLGANRGTKWFVLTGVIVDSSIEKDIRSTLQAIKTKFNYQAIHWRKIGEFNKRAYIASALAKHEFTYVNILFDTSQYDTAKFPSVDIAYNYLCRLLLERVSWYMRDTNRVGAIVLSSRGTSKDAGLIDYINSKLLTYPKNQIAKQVFTKVTAKTAPSWDLLQLADICATTMFNWHEADWLGFVTPCHAMKFREKLYKYDDKIERYGLKYFPDSAKPTDEYFKQHQICTKKGGTPSATAT